MAKTPGDSSDFWQVQLPKLIADGWLFLGPTQFGEPLYAVGYTPFALPAGMANNPANRRKLNRPFSFELRVTGTPADPRLAWTGVLRVGAVSALTPWVAGATAPYGEDADWAQGPTHTYLADWSMNPVAQDEMSVATPDTLIALGMTRTAPYNPAATVTGSYPGLWTIPPEANGDWHLGYPNAQAQYNALADLFTRLSV
jgi:hypothetical protein